MRLPVQAVPVHRSRSFRSSGTATSGLRPQAKDYQCWTDYGCNGLAFDYVDNCAQCSGKGGRSIRSILNNTCTNC